MTKSLYGLKQASRQWYEKLASYLLTIGFIQSQADNSLFIKKIEKSFIALLVYVDDIILIGDDMHEINIMKNLLNVTFKIKDLGKLKYFLGLEIARTHEGSHLCQKKYALEILDDAGMLGAKPTTTPMQKKTENMFEEVDIHEPSSYRRLIERLLYLVNTRPEICFAVQHLSQFVQKPTIHHHRAVQHVLRYIKAALAQGLFYSKNSVLHLKAFTDSD